MYYAHTKPGRPEVEWQLLANHLGQVAELAAKFAAAFDSADWARATGWLHDFGKLAARVQAYLRRVGGLEDSEDAGGGGVMRVNHSSAGAGLAIERWNELIGTTLAYLVAGHHAGLADYYATNIGKAALAARLPEGRRLFAEIKPLADEILAQLPTTLRCPPWLKPDGYALWVRMLFSCLVDADYLDTEAALQPERTANRRQFATLPKLKIRLDTYLHELGEKASAQSSTAHSLKLNRCRRELLAACRTAAEQPPGWFSLTAPTGSGKTLSSVAFGLDHAVRHGRSRIIYVVHYTSIIEQTADTLRIVFGNGQVIEHHCNLDPERETPCLRLAAENWDAPIVVTTNVQFFESCYASQPSRCRKLHNIVNSVVILDEAQLLPPRWLTPCIDVMNRLVENYGVTIVLSTATQPALPGLSRRPLEIVPNPAELFAALIRTDIHIPADLHQRLTWPELAVRLQTHERVLCTVNTRRDCYELFHLMPEGTIHLSALMCGQHRSRVVAEIKRRLLSGEGIRVVSTQIIESGTNVDFPVGHRALAGLDSLGQFAGRCNREGLLPDRGQVYVFVPPDDPSDNMLRKGVDTTRALAASGELHPHLPEEFTRYFSLFYSAVNDTGADWLREGLVRDVPYVQFRTAANEFRFIDDRDQRPVIVLYGGSQQLLNQLRRTGTPTRRLLRLLQRFTVNLPIRTVATMLADGRLVEIVPGIVAQHSRELYDQQTGLNVYH
jgi:CRISPR-associated endonuclease/helicase Cas3